MVRYTDTPEVNKRMVAGYYLFLCLLGFAILLGPTGSGIPITLVGDEGRYQHDLSAPDNATYTDVASCATCHADQHGNWSITGHADTAVYLNGTHIWVGRNASYLWRDVATFNATCAECHASDRIDGNTSDGSWTDLGVNCFACHDMTSPWVDYSGDACARCHTGDPEGDHPYQFLFWQESVHANSLTDLRASGHPASYCMHCQAAEAFIHQQNPGMLANTNPNVNTTFDPSGDYNSITCPACHSVHSIYSNSTTYPAMIRAVNASELCGLCHVGSHHPMYEVWIGSTHNLAGVECIDCHGYDLTISSGEHFLNHSFVVEPDIACGQEGCHEDDLEEWALGQLEMIEVAFDALVEEIETEAAALTTIVETYNATAGADHDLVAEVMTMIEEVEDVVHYYEYDKSRGFHDRADIFQSLNDAFRELVEAKAYFYENTPAATVTITDTVTETVTVTVTVGGGFDTLTLVGGAGGGIVLGLLLGILVGRRR